MPLNQPNNQLRLDTIKLSESETVIKTSRCMYKFGLESYETDFYFSGWQPSLKKTDHSVKI